MPRHHPLTRARQALAPPAPRLASPAAPTPSAGPCPHRCNHTWRRSVADYEAAATAWALAGRPGPPPPPVTATPWPGRPVLCLRCAATIRDALRELPVAYTALNSVKYLTRTASADEERRARADTARSPSPGADHQDEILRTVHAWENDLRRHLCHRAATDTGTPTTDLAASVDYLNAHYRAMIERPGRAAEFADAIWRLHRVSVAMVKNKPVRRHLPTPCPSPGCGIKALIQDEGIAGKPWCIECAEHLGGCGRRYAESDWEWFGKLLVNGDIPVTVAA